MKRTNRIRAGILMGSAALATAAPTVAPHADLIYLAGRLVQNRDMVDVGNAWMAWGAVAAGTGALIGVVSAPTGVGAAAGGALVGAGGVTAGVGG